MYRYDMTAALMNRIVSFEFLVRPQNMTVNIGANVSLQCTANENSLYFTWEYKSHRDVSNKDGLVLGFCFRGKQCVVKLWRNHVRITNSSRLSLLNISSDHSGQYLCETTPSNGYDIIKASAWIFVKTPPKMISVEFNKSQNIFNENETVEIKCAVYGANPPPNVVISVVVGNVLKNLKTTMGRSLSSPSTEMHVYALWRPVFSEHRGFVMCSAGNDAGSLSTNSSLVNINFAPKIQSFQPNSISAAINQTIDLSCLVSANPPAKVQWIINDGLLKIASSMLISKVRPEMTGNITCIAENPLGSSSKSVKLVVLKDPVITITSLRKIKESSDASVTCQVEATPSPDFIHWYKESQIGPNIQSTLISNDASLNFVKIDRSSSGKYACVTKNTQKPTNGEAKEVTVKKYIELIVTYQPGEPWINSDEEVKVQKGEQIRILCNVNSKNPGEPLPTLSWIDVDTRDVISRSHELFVEKADTFNSGNYRCAATNERGVSVSSKIMLITVHERPMIIFHKKSNLFLSHSNLPNFVSFPCTFEGHPLHAVSWHYRGSRISSTALHQITTHRSISSKRAVHLSSNLTVRLYSQHLTDQSTSKYPPSGTYSCECTNEYGTASFEYCLVIKYPPLIVLRPHERKVAGELGEAIVSMKCKVESIEEPQIAWIRTSDGMELQNLDNKYSIVTVDIAKYNLENDALTPGIKVTELRIFDLLLGDFTGYSCLATNGQGSSRAFMEVVFKSKPDVPYDVRVVSVEWDSITISWKSGFNGGKEQQFEINVYSDIIGTQNVPFYKDNIDNRLTVNGLRPSTNYSVQIYSKNTLGRSSDSSTVTCVTKQIFKFDRIYAKISSDRPQVAIFVPEGDLSANLDYTRDNGRQWFSILERYKLNSSHENFTNLVDLSFVTSQHDLQAGLVRIRLSYCLQSRPDVCSKHTILDNPKNATLTTQAIILIVAVMCIVLIIILVVLFIICCVRLKCRRSRSTTSRSQIHKRISENDFVDDRKIVHDDTARMTSPSNYCSSLIGCSTPHTTNINDVYSSFTCQHQAQSPVYYEGSSFLQPALFSWPPTVSPQPYEASSSNSHSSAGSSSRTMKYRSHPDNLSNSVIINKKSLLELNERMQLPDVTSEAIHFVTSMDSEHVLEAVV